MGECSAEVAYWELLAMHLTEADASDVHCTASRSLRDSEMGCSRCSATHYLRIHLPYGENVGCMLERTRRYGTRLGQPVTARSCTT